MYADCVLAATRLSRCTSGTCRDAAPDGLIPFSVRLAPPLPLRPSSPDQLEFGLFQLRYSPPLADSHRPSLRSADESRWGRQDRVLWRLSGRRDGWGASVRPRGARCVAIRAGSRRRFWTRADATSAPAPSSALFHGVICPVQRGGRESRTWDRRNSAILVGFERLG